MRRIGRMCLLAWPIVLPPLIIGRAVDAAPIDLTVMTQNLYIGADTTPILTAPDLATAQARAAAAFNMALANNFDARAGAIASEIDASGSPLLIGLQEATIIGGGGVTLDYGQMLLNQLATRGLDYTVAGMHTNLSLSLGGFTATDRELVLARTGVPGFNVAGSESHTFANNVSLSTILGPVSLNRGYVLVHATLDGVPFQFASTHLDEFQTPLQPLQADEILSQLTNSTGPQLVVGDFNAVPGTQTYDEMTASGFFDTAASVGSVGPTCCQAADLSNPVSELSDRYDYVFERGFPSVDAAYLVGNTPFEDVQPLWPSDHAGVVATLDLPVPEPSSGAVFITSMFLLLCTLKYLSTWCRKRASANRTLTEAADDLQKII